MSRVYNTVILLLMFCMLGFSQQMDTTSYRDLSIPYVETNPSRYNFEYPILSDILDSSNFSPPDEGVYLKATYGHRYLSNTSNKTDNHGGFDYWSDHIYNGIVYDDNNKAPIICMCDGIISEVVHGPDSVLELTATGRSVQVTCDSIYQSFGSNIIINYRHLSSLDSLASIADTAQPNSIAISKGEIIGYMGESGTTTNVHLHLSTQTDHPIYGNAFVNTARLFDATFHPGILQGLKNARIELLYDWADSALFRITWPFNQTINRFEFANQSFSVFFDKEDAYETGAAIRDYHDCVPGIRVYAYQFNGKQTAAARYQSEMINMPANYPASPQRDTNLTIYGYPHVPITFDSIAYVYDFIIENIPTTHVKEDFIVKLSDVWGNVVEGTFPPISIINEQHASQVKTFPNPTSNHLRISLSKNGPKQINLFDVFGRSLLSKNSSQSNILLDLSALSNGVYFLLIRMENSILSTKIIKE